MTTTKSKSAISVALMALISLCVPLGLAQRPTNVPRLVQFGGIVKEPAGKPVVGITFALYKDQQGGAAVWMETQNVALDESGRYTVMLGATRNEGLPVEVFHSGEARWLGVQAEGQPEQSRVLLLSVPYALKAADAETIGGLPASAFVLAAPPLASSTGNASPAADTSTPGPSLAGSGTINFIPLWTSSTGNLGNSVMFQSGTGSTAKIGINTTTPSTALDVKGGATIRGAFSLPAEKTSKSTTPWIRPISTWCTLRWNPRRC